MTSVGAVGDTHSPAVSLRPLILLGHRNPTGKNSSSPVHSKALEYKHIHIFNVFGGNYRENPKPGGDNQTHMLWWFYDPMNP